MTAATSHDPVVGLALQARTSSAPTNAELADLKLALTRYDRGYKPRPGGGSRFASAVYIGTDKRRTGRS